MEFKAHSGQTSGTAASRGHTTGMCPMEADAGGIATREGTGRHDARLTRASIPRVTTPPRERGGGTPHARGRRLSPTVRARHTHTAPSVPLPAHRPNRGSPPPPAALRPPPHAAFSSPGRLPGPSPCRSPRP